MRYIYDHYIIVCTVLAIGKTKITFATLEIPWLFSLRFNCARVLWCSKTN